MSGYIGLTRPVVTPGAERKKTFAVTSTQTVFTGLSYTPEFVHVYHNGVRLVDGTDYTATNGNSITLTSAAQNGDEVVVISYASFQPSDTVSASAGGFFGAPVDFNNTSHITLPKGTTAERPASPVEGMIRFNTTGGYIEEYRDSQWFALSKIFSATGGAVSTYTDGATTYKVHTFTSSGTFSVLSGSDSVDYLIVGGGGGGGVIGGGGGAGGVLSGSVSVGISFNAVVIGGGGNNSGSFSGSVATNGGDSSVFGLTAIGGGAGGRHVGGSTSTAGSSGGSGGGGADNGSAGGSGTTGQGNAGGAGVPGVPGTQRLGGGGGGAGQAGNNWNVSNGKGGDGIQSAIDGTNYYYAGGGGAGGYNSTTGGNGGLGGGGGGAVFSGTAGTGGGSARNAGGNGTVGADGQGGLGGQNTGGGAGGASFNVSTVSSRGGSGIVIIRYAI